MWVIESSTVGVLFFCLQARFTGGEDGLQLVGGMGTILGPVVGAAVIVTMQNYLAGLGEWVLVIQGVIFVVAVSLFRRGIAGEIVAIGRLWTAKKTNQ